MGPAADPSLDGAVTSTAQHPTKKQAQDGETPSLNKCISRGHKQVPKKARLGHFVHFGPFVAIQPIPGGS